MKQYNICHPEGTQEEEISVKNDFGMKTEQNVCELTVVTVCRNAESTIHRCIDSISPLLRHTKLSVEYLIIDGASTDTTLEILNEALKKGKISRFITEPDYGIYDAMNKGISQAKGQVCVFINADDEINAKAVEDCLTPILSGEVDYTVSSVCVLSDEGKNARVCHPDFSKTWFSAPYCHQGMYCRTDLLKKEGGFSHDFKIAADCALMWKLYEKQYPFRIINATSASFSAGGASSGCAAYKEHLCILMQHSEKVLQRASSDTRYRDCVLRMLGSYLQVVLGSEASDATIIESLYLHRSIVNKMRPIARLRKILTYRMKYIQNKLGLLFARKERKEIKASRIRLYSHLLRYC